MKKLQIKRDNFSSGKKFFVNEDGSFQMSSVVPASFSFGVEIPPEGGTFNFSSSDSSYVIRVEPAGSFYVFVNKEGFTQQTLGTSFTKVTYPNISEERPRVYFPDTRLYVYYLTENFAALRDRDDASAILIINFKTEEEFEFSYPLTPLATTRFFSGVYENGDNLYLQFRDRTSSFPYTHTFYLATFSGETLSVEEVTKPGSASVANIVTDGNIHVTDEFTYMYIAFNTILKLDNQGDLLYYRDDVLEDVNDSLAGYNISVHNGYVYFPCYSYDSAGVYGLDVVRVQDTGTGFSVPERLQLDYFIEASAAGYGFSELYYSQVVGDTLYLGGWLWDNYANTGDVFENGIYLAAVNTNTFEKVWSRLYYASEVAFPLEEGGLFKILVLEDRIFMGMDSIQASSNDEKVYIFSTEDGSFIERIVPAYRYVIL